MTRSHGTQRPARAIIAGGDRTLFVTAGSLARHEADRPTPPQQERAVKLAAALERLPEAQREALVRQHWEGWSLAEIAEHMGRTRAAVAGLLKRGLSQLRTEMQDSQEG